MNLILGPILGHTTATTTRLWIYTDSAIASGGALCHIATDNQFTQPIPGSPFPFNVQGDNNTIGTASISALAPGSRYFYKVTYQGQTLGDSAYPFQTLLNAAPDEFSFALVSCHAPFKYSGDSRTTMWQRLSQEVATRAENNKPVSFLLQVGDQIYADEKDHFWQSSPWDKCLAMDTADPQTAARRQALYRDTYVRYWDFPVLRQLYARLPQYMMWDDHDITNGWGSGETHQNVSEQSTFAAAKAVYRQFQHVHNPGNSNDPDALYYGFHLGAASFLVLDLRGQRQMWNKQLLGDAQRQWAKQFIEQCQNTKTLFVVTSVPLFHLGPLWAWIPLSDVTDQWSDEHNRVDRRYLLKYLFDWMEAKPERRVVILGGDVHIGTFCRATRDTSNRSIVQITSSPVSNKPAGLLDRFVRRVSGKFSTRDADDHVVDVDITNRFTQRNYAMITVSNLNTANPQIKCELYDESRPAATEVLV